MRKFKALGNATRMRLLNILFHYELSVNELVELMKLSQSGISQHLKILTDARLLHFRRDGLQVFYSASNDAETADFLADILRHYPAALPGEADLLLAAGKLDARAARARQFFDVIAEKWDELNREILGGFNLYARISQIMPNCDVAADLGCGTGHILDAMLDHAKTCIGVDSSPSMIELCKKRLENRAGQSGCLSLRLGELDHLPIGDKEVAFASMNLVLHHLPAPAEVFPEILRILKPGGTLFIADLKRHNDEDMRIRYGDQWLGFEPEDLAANLARAGFAVQNLETAPVGRGLTLLLFTAQAGCASGGA